VEFVRLRDDSVAVPTGFWVALDETGRPRGFLTRPPGPAAQVLDLKRWALDGTPERKQLPLIGGDGKAIRLSLETAVELFLGLIFQAAGLQADRRPWFLLPAEADDARRSAYLMLLRKAAIRAIGRDERTGDAAGYVSFAFEPDMAFEYFRLVRGGLRVPPGENAAILVVDCGALTCNVSVLLTTTAGDIGEGTFGRSRGPLRAIQAEAQKFAGKDFDHLLASEMEEALGGDFKSLHPFDRSTIAEHAKVAVSLTRADHAVESPAGRRHVLTLERLRTVTAETWAKQYRRHIEDVIRRAYEQLRGSPSRRARLERDGVHDVVDFTAKFRAVILAGGTSQLPGFREALAKVLPNPKLQIFQVRSDYPAVGAAGGLAHVLHRRQALTIVASTDATGALDAGELPASVGQLIDDVYVRCVAREGETRTWSVLRRGDWPMEQPQRIELSYGDRKRRSLDFRLAWGPHGEHWLTSADGGRWTKLNYAPERGGITAEVHADSEDVLTVTLIHGDQRIKLHGYVGPVASVRAGAPTSMVGEGRVHFRRAPDFVVDFGMSKTMIAVSNDDGVLPAEAFSDLSISGIQALPPPGWRIMPAVDRSPSPPPADDERDPDVRVSDLKSAQHVLPATVAPTGDEAPHVENDGGTEETPHAPRARRQAVPIPLLPTDTDERTFLVEALERLRSAGYDVDLPELATLHLAMKIRPLLLLAGPSGTGKTALAEAYGTLLGCSRERRSLERVAVEAHWIDAEALIGKPHGRLLHLLEPSGAPSMRLLLLDEFNLTRPEYFFGRFLSAMESDGQICPRTPLDWPSDGGIRTLLVVGTLNIDETSRPPADKVLDRAFVLERSTTFESLESVTRLARPESGHAVGASLWGRWIALDDAQLRIPRELQPILELLAKDAGRHGGFAPSRRAVWDVSAFVAMSARLDFDEHPRHAALDGAVCGRLLPRLRGHSQRFAGLLERLRDTFPVEYWPNCHARVDAMIEQMRLTGVADFWGG
jgi:hypothetical protein